jgi:hypothetical protein
MDDPLSEFHEEITGLLCEWADSIEDTGDTGLYYNMLTSTLAIVFTFAAHRLARGERDFFKHTVIDYLDTAFDSSEEFIPEVDERLH